MDVETASSRAILLPDAGIDAADVLALEVRVSLDDFDPNGPGAGDGLFGLPLAVEECAVQCIPVPWGATASYGRGAADGPGAILEASQQVDLHDLDYGDFWRRGVGMLPVDPRVVAWAAAAEADAVAVIAAGGGCPERAARVDALAGRVNDLVATAAEGVLDRGGIPAVVGGDHSCPRGLVRALAGRFPGMGVLHIDAHADLRAAYLGFENSHASIWHNGLALDGVSRLVGVGWRDVGSDEVARCRAEPDRIRPFTDRRIALALAQGRTWWDVCGEIVAALPDDVYISLDIDGLDPALCPNTGTPVPGGLSFRDLQTLLWRLSQERRVIGFDLCEVAPAADDEWDANVGARVLYKLAGCAIRSREPASSSVAL